MIRFFDFVFSFIGLLILSPFLFIIFFVCLIETGSPIFIQDRLGLNKKVFRLIQFRTMKINTKNLATHLISKESISSSGKYIRMLKLDELPQLINVIKGDMSLVGPRPNLKNQNELILEREKLNIYDIRPGITGLAQINKIDMSKPYLLAKTDFKMKSNFTASKYFMYILSTIINKNIFHLYP